MQQISFAFNQVSIDFIKAIISKVHKLHKYEIINRIIYFIVIIKQDFYLLKIIIEI